MALATERIKFIVDVDTGDFVRGMRQMAQTLENSRDALGAFDRISVVDAIGDAALAKAEQYWKALKGIASATSDLNEAANFSQKVFGEAAPEIEKFAEGAAKIGFSKTSALNAAAALGVFGKTAGKTGEELVQFTTELVTLAADMASVKNTAPEDAIIALGAAMRSEYEPLRKYGVVLNDVQLRERALALGIYDGTGALNSQQRILAARAEVMKQLAFAEGDFVDTSDQLANKQRILAANLENLKTKIGQGLIPVFIGLTDIATKTVDVLSKLDPTILKLAGSISVLGVAALKAVGLIAKLYTSLQTLSQIPQLTGLIAALGSALPLAAGAAALAVGALGIAVYDAAQEVKKAKEDLAEFNREILATRGNVAAAVELKVRAFFDDEDATRSIESIGETAEAFMGRATEAIQGTDDRFKKFTDDLTATRNAIAATSLEDPRVAALDTLIEKSELARQSYLQVRDQMAAADKKAAEAAAEDAAAQAQLTEQLQKQLEQITKTRSEAIDSKNKAIEDLNKAKAKVVEEQMKAVADFEKDQLEFLKHIEDAERAIERQRRSIEDANQGIIDAQERVVDAVRNEEKAREGIDRALRSQADAQEDLVRAQEGVVDAQEEFAAASQRVERLMRGYGQASKEAADALEELDDAQRRVRSSQLALEDATIELGDAQTQLDRLRRFYGNTSSPSALRRIADAERAVARAQLQREEAVDDLEGSTKDLSDTQDEYNWIVNGYPAESEKVRQAMKDQEAAAKSLESAIKTVDSAQRGLVDAQRAVDDARLNAKAASDAVIDAEKGVQRAVQDAQWSTDDLRRAEWELATYRVSGQPTMAMDAVRSAEEQVRDARAQVVQETYNLLAAESALAAFRAANPYNPATSPIMQTPGFMSGGNPPAGSFGFNGVTFEINVHTINDPYATGKYIAQELERYLKATGQMPLHGSVWR